MRVITGSAKGRKLISPDGLDVRPTVDRVKEGVFSALHFDLEGRRVLDLFAGSGQMGIEALSRGAGFCTFVDSSAKSLDCVRKNVAACKMNDQAKIVSADSLSFLKTCSDTFDIAFLDPPYKMGLIEKAMEVLPSKMSDYGIIMCEHPSDEKLPERFGDFSVAKEYRYGRVLVTAYKKSE